MHMFRYHLPVITAVHHKLSPWRGSNSQLDATLFDGSLFETLRIVWNIAWHDGIEPAIASRDTASDG